MIKMAAKKEYEYDTEIIDISGLTLFLGDVRLVKLLAEKDRKRGVDSLFVNGPAPLAETYCQRHEIPVRQLPAEVTDSDNFARYIHKGSKPVYAVRSDEDREKVQAIRTNLASHSS